MSVFDVFNEAKTNSGYRYMEADQVYELKVEKISYLDDRKEAYAVEFEILETSSEKQSPGQTVSFYQATDGISCPAETAAGSIKSFLAAVCKINEDAISVEDMRLSFSEEQPLTGEVVSCETVSHVTQKGGDFTKHNWSVSKYEEKK